MIVQRKPRPKKRKGKIKISQKARIVKRNDTDTLARPDARIPMLKRRIPQDNGATFKVKLKRKR